MKQLASRQRRERPAWPSARPGGAKKATAPLWFPPWMSFPRKRESSWFFWIPACAGM